MISKDKQYRTRDGREVRIYATDGKGCTAIHGAVYENQEWISFAWHINGRYSAGFQNGPYDLIEVRPRIKRTVWLNVFDFHCVAWSCKEHADTQGGRIACVKVEIDCEEGEGL